MKKFARFDVDDYYPTSGFGDLIGSYDTLDEALETKGRGDKTIIYDISGDRPVEVHYRRRDDY